MKYRRYPAFSPDRVFAWAILIVVIVGFAVFTWWFWS